MIQHARDFAQRAHGEQKYGDLPYLVHLDAVADLVKPYGETAQVVAYLHDVVEDTLISTAEVEANFGGFVADCVAILTDEPGDSRKERKTKTYAKMAKVDAELSLALLVKAADRLANVEACVAGGHWSLLAKYREEHSAFRKAVYRPGLCDELWERLEAVMAGP